MIVHTLHQRSSLHSLFFTSLHFYTFYHQASNPFTSLIVTFLTLFLKISYIEGNVSSASAGSWFQSLMVLYIKEYFPIYVLCHDHPCSGSMVVVTCSLWLSVPILLSIPRRGHKCMLFLHCTKVSQIDSFEKFANF